MALLFAQYTDSLLFFLVLVYGILCVFLWIIHIVLSSPFKSQGLKPAMQLSNEGLLHCMVFQQTWNRGIILIGGPFRFNYRFISAVARWWSLTTSAPLRTFTSLSERRHLPLTNKWSIWILSCPFGEHQVCLWVILCAKRVSSIAKLLVLHQPLLSPSLFITPHPCLLISLCYLLFSEPTFAFVSPTTRSRSWLGILATSTCRVMQYFFSSSWAPFVGVQHWITDIYVICRLGGPYSEKLWPRSWKCCPRLQTEGSIFKPEVTVFHYTDRP